MPTLSSRRKPWPWDARLMLAPTTIVEGSIGHYRGTLIASLLGRQIWTLRGVSRTFRPSQGFMLLPGQAGLLVGKKQTSLENIYPQTPDYDSAPVYRERTFMFRPTGGMGESVQSSITDRRYHYAINVWVHGGLIGRGPLSHKVSPTTSANVRRFAEARGNLFLLAGPYVLRRVSDSDTGLVTERTRAGQSAIDAQRFQGGFAGATESLYVSWTDGVLEEWNGSAWTNCALPASFFANFLEVVGDELWAADATRSQIRKVTSDPKVAANWSGLFQIGDASVPITAIRQINNQLLIFKSDGGIFTINSDGSDSDLFPGLTTSLDATNGMTAWAWLGALWFRVGQSFYRLAGDMQLTPIGPGRMVSNASEVRGLPVAFCGWNSQMAFLLLYNTTNSTSYLLQYGNWEPKTGDEGTEFIFTDQWDGATVRWIGRQATCLWSSNVPEPRLYVGFADGSYDWIKLVAYPLARDGGGEYTADESYIVAPLHHATYQADRKQWIGFSAFGPVFDQGDRVTVEYRLAGSAGMPSAQPAGAAWQISAPITFNGQRVDAERLIAGYSVELRFDLGGGTPTHTLVVEGIAVHERLVPQFRLDYNLTADARSVIARRDGSSTRRNGRHIRDMLTEAAAQPASVTLELPDETVSDCAFFQYTEHMVPHSERGGQGWAIEIAATQFKISEIYGIIGRLRGTRIGDLRGFQIKALRYM